MRAVFRASQLARSGGFGESDLPGATLPAERLEDARLGGRDKFESAEFVALVLSAGSIVKVLSQHRLKSGFRNRWSR
jgi:hypothetical protein